MKQERRKRVMRMWESGAADRIDDLWKVTFEWRLEQNEAGNNTKFQERNTTEVVRPVV